MILETQRLYLRELIPSDRDDLASVLCDPLSMVYYPAPFTLRQVEDWIDWNIENYQKYHHGLRAVILKESNTFLGDCGNGYATEAAGACMEYAFSTLGYQALYTYTKHDNSPSRRVAEKIGMTFVRTFDKTVQGSTVREALYQKNREE